ncbi:MAG: hypothetical protein IJ315_09370 [Firmicutes bacterium]|nr:hypothetical protein [Bacillota bacterium]
MKVEQIHDALNLLDDSIVQQVGRVRSKKRQRWYSWAAVAACFCIIVVSALRAVSFGAGGSGFDGAAGENVTSGGSDALVDGAGQLKEGVTIPMLDLSTKNGEMSDMMALFIYQGRIYVEYVWIEGTELVGKRLGTANGTIDCWTREEGYVEQAGTVAGDFYQVKGYDPSFMLCMKREGETHLFINNNGIAMVKGMELYEERLHLGGNYSTLEYYTKAQWNNGTGQVKNLTEDDRLVTDRFVAALMDAEFIYTEQGMLDEMLYLVDFQMDNGVQVRLRLYEGGYVEFVGMRSICVQVDMDELLQFLEG